MKFYILILNFEISLAPIPEFENKSWNFYSHFGFSNLTSYFFHESHYLRTWNHVLLFYKTGAFYTYSPPLISPSLQFPFPEFFRHSFKTLSLNLHPSPISVDRKLKLCTPTFYPFFTAISITRPFPPLIPTALCHNSSLPPSTY